MDLIEELEKKAREQYGDRYDEITAAQKKVAELIMKGSYDGCN